MIEKLQKAITTTIDREINPTIKELKDRQKETYSNLDHSRDKFVSKLKNSVFDAIDRFESDLREEMYGHIDKDIENKECEEIFENELIQGIETLHEYIKWRFRECEKRFDGEIKEAIKQLKYRIKDSLAMLEHISIDRGFNLNFDTDSGIDGTKLATSIGGLGLLGIFNAWNPMGWFALTIGIIAGLVGVVKSVWSWFSSDYKKSQQRKEVDKNLDKVCEKIEEEMRNHIEDAKKVICEKVESLKIRLNNPVVCYECMREGLIKAGEGLWQISNNIKTRIAQ